METNEQMTTIEVPTVLVAEAQVFQIDVGRECLYALNSAIYRAVSALSKQRIAGALFSVLRGNYADYMRMPFDDLVEKMHTELLRGTNRAALIAAVGRQPARLEKDRARRAAVVRP